MRGGASRHQARDDWACAGVIVLVVTLAVAERRGAWQSRCLPSAKLIEAAASSRANNGSGNRHLADVGCWHYCWQAVASSRSAAGDRGDNISL